MNKTLRIQQIKIFLLLFAVLATLLCGLLYILYGLSSRNAHQSNAHHLNNQEWGTMLRTGQTELIGPEHFTVEISTQTGDSVIFSSLNLEDREYQSLIAFALEDILPRTATHNQWRDSIQNLVYHRPPHHIDIDQRRFTYLFVDYIEPLEWEHVMMYAQRWAYLLLREREHNETTHTIIPRYDDSIDLAADADTRLHYEAFLEELNQLRRGEESPFLYVIFFDVTHLQTELDTLRQVFFQVGGIALFGILFISYLISLLLIRPIVKAFKEQKQFIADISHELKTPLTIMKSNYGVLVTNQKDTIENQKEWLHAMHFGMNRLQHLALDMLTLAEMDHTDFSLQKDNFDFSQQVKKLIPVFQARAFKKDTEIRLHLPAELPLHHDREKLMQVMMILIDNSVKYVDHNGFIEIHIFKKRKRLYCTVKNSGPGIAKEHLTALFKRFYRVDSARETQEHSHGLGLAIAYETIKKCRGKLTVHSIPNEITTFSFHIRL